MAKKQKRRRPTAAQLAERRKNRLVDSLRQKILQRLREMGRSRKWLSEQVKSVHTTTSQAFLYSGRNTRADVIAEMMEIVGLEVTSKEKETITA